MKQTVIFLIGLIAVIIISFTGCKEETAKEENPDVIAANLLKQGAADPELLLGEWNFIRFAYTKDGKEISDRNTLGEGTPIPQLEISSTATLIENEMLKMVWRLWFINSYRFHYSLKSNIIKFESCDRTYVYSPKYDHIEREIDAAFCNAYSFVIKDNKLIIYFKKGEDKNLLILEKRL